MKFLIERILQIIQKRELIAKAISLLLAVILWAFISNTKTGDIKFKIPIEKKNLSDDLTILNISEKFIYVTLGGKKEYLKNIDIKNIKAYVDLRKPKIGIPKKYKIELVKNQVPDRINVTQSLSEVKITIDKKAQKRVKIHPNLIGNLKKGSIIGKIIIEPEYIFITGPKSLVDEINFFHTEDISIENESGEIVREVEIKKDKYKEIIFSETNIKVNIPIIEYGNYYSYEVPIIVKKISEKFNYILKTPKVKIYIKTSDVKRITNYDLEASIDIERLKLNEIIKKGYFEEREEEFFVNILVKKYANIVEIISVIPERVILKIIKK